MTYAFDEVTNHLGDHSKSMAPNFREWIWGTDNDNLELRYKKLMKKLEDYNNSTFLASGCDNRDLNWLS